MKPTALERRARKAVERFEKDYEVSMGDKVRFAWVCGAFTRFARREVQRFARKVEAEIYDCPDLRMDELVWLLKNVRALAKLERGGR